MKGKGMSPTAASSAEREHPQCSGLRAWKLGHPATPSEVLRPRRRGPWRFGADPPQSASKSARLGDPLGPTQPGGHCGAAGSELHASPARRAPNRQSDVPTAGPPMASPQAAPGAPPAPGRKELARQTKASRADVAPGKPTQFFGQ